MCSAFTWNDMYTVLEKYSDVNLMSIFRHSCLREHVQVCVFCDFFCVWCVMVPAMGRVLYLLDYISPSHRGKRLLLRSGARGIARDGEVKRRRGKRRNCNVNLWRPETCAVSLSLVTVTEVCNTVLCSTHILGEKGLLPAITLQQLIAIDIINIMTLQYISMQM